MRRILSTLLILVVAFYVGFFMFPDLLNWLPTAGATFCVFRYMHDDFKRMRAEHNG